MKYYKYLQIQNCIKSQFLKELHCHHEQTWYLELRCLSWLLTYVSKCEDSKADAVVLNLSICSCPFSNFSKMPWNTQHNGVLDRKQTIYRGSVTLHTLHRILNPSHQMKNSRINAHSTNNQEI